MLAKWIREGLLLVKYRVNRHGCHGHYSTLEMLEDDLRRRGALGPCDRLTTEWLQKNTSEFIQAVESNYLETWVNPILDGIMSGDRDEVQMLTDGHHFEITAAAAPGWEKERANR